MDYEIGSRAGDYKILDVLGAGGMGKVYKVQNVISDRIEAMKVLLPNLEGDPELADRFIRDPAEVVQTGTRLKVRVFDFYSPR